MPGLSLTLPLQLLKAAVGREIVDDVLTAPRSSSTDTSSSCSDNATFDVELFWKLPYLIRKQIVENLSPLDYLNLAEVSQDFYDFLYDLPKSMHCAESLSGGIWGWCGRAHKKPYRKTFVTWEIPPEAMQLSKKSTEFEEFVVFKRALSFEGGDEMETKQLRFLRHNSVLRTLTMLRGILEENVKAKKISTMSDSWEDLLKELEHTGATELEHNGYLEMNKDTKIREVFENQLMQRLQCFHFTLNGSIIPHLTLLKAERMRFSCLGLDDIIKHWDEFMDYLGTLVKEWKSGARQLDSFTALFPTSGDEMNFKYNAIAKRLAFGQDGGFISKWTDRVQLIERSDGRGLLIWSGALALVMVECDYEYRRRAGFGNSAMRRVIFDQLRSLAEKRKERKLRATELEPPKNEELFEEKLRKKEEESAIEAEEEERIKELLAELHHLEYSRRETNIDRLFDGHAYDDVVDLGLLQLLSCLASWPGDEYKCRVEEETLSISRGELKIGERFYFPPEV